MFMIAILISPEELIPDVIVPGGTGDGQNDHSRKFRVMGESRRD
jgi:hypothetical protein